MYPVIAIKIKEAATVASTAVVGAAGVTGTKVKATWESTKEGWQTSVQPRMTATWQSTKDGWQSNVKPKVEAAARAVVEAGVLIKKNILETKEKVASAALHKRIAEVSQSDGFFILPFDSALFFVDLGIGHKKLY